MQDATMSQRPVCPPNEQLIVRPGVARTSRPVVRVRDPSSAHR